MSKKLALILAFFAPLLFLSLLGLFVFIPSNEIQPRYDFIYSTSSFEDNKFYYKIVNNKIEKVESNCRAFNSRPNLENNNTQANPTTKYCRTDKDTQELFLYRIGDGNSRQVSFEEVKNYKLDGSEISPDGFRLEDNYNSSSFFVFGSS